MSQGRVLYSVRAGGNQDALTGSTDPAVRKFIHDHAEGLVTYTPYFDDKLAWFPRAFAYVDSYALYVKEDAALIAAHPDWILKSAAGKPLYIPYGNPPLPQYAGDFSNAGFRAYIIARVQAIAAKGYQGVFMDDVNLPVRSTDGTLDKSGNLVSVLPAGWTESSWADNMSNFMQVLRASLPSEFRIIHNSIWYAPNSPAVMNQIASADVIFLERGASDSGLTGGTGPFSLAAFMSFVEYVNSLDTACWFDELSDADMEASVAVYLLTNNEANQIGFEDLLLQSPWPNLLMLDLGAATTPRSVTNGIWYRRFTRGIVYRNDPGAPTATFTLPQPAYDMAGNEIASVTLGPGQGKIVRFERE